MNISEAEQEAIEEDFGLRDVSADALLVVTPAAFLDELNLLLFDTLGTLPHLAVEEGTETSAARGGGLDQGQDLIHLRHATIIQVELGSSTMNPKNSE